MFKNYFKVAFRNLARNKSHAIINISGLAVGITVCLIIFFVISFELSYDNYHQKKDQIYRVLTEYHHPNTSPFTSKAVPYAIPEVLRTSVPQIEKVAPVYIEEDAQIMVLDNNGNSIHGFREETGVFFSQPALFDIFDFEWLAGSPTILKNPNVVVLTKDTAEKYFGSWEVAMGKNLKWNRAENIEVVGIIDKVPKNSDLQVKMVISYGTGYTSGFLKSKDWDSTNGEFGTFLLLSKNASIEAINEQLNNLSKENKSSGNRDTHLIQPLSEIHYDTASGNFSGKSISIQLINVLGIIAGFILLIACVNFINLSTAQAVNRSKEIGVRKVLGGNKIQLRIQFLAETFLLVLFAILLSLGIVAISIKYVGGLFDVPLNFESITEPGILLFFAIMAVSVTLLAGFYPSIVLSRFSPINALKNKVNYKGGGFSLRKGLVVFQFAIAQVLIIGTIIMINQMDYFMNQPLGFEKEAVVSVPLPGDSLSLNKVSYLRNRLASINGVKNASFSYGTPISDGNWWTTFGFDNRAKKTDFFVICKSVDQEYLPTYGMSLLAGRNVRSSNTNKEFLINETLMKKLGFSNPEEAINKEVNLGDGDVIGPIVGVLRDFHARSFKRELDPVLMTTETRWFDRAGMKLASSNVLETVDAIEGVWKEAFPDYVFQYNFLDAQVANYYGQEKRLTNIYKISAALAIFLSCLGLYGLASFLVGQRIKEAGIRKVLGATRRSIVCLFSKEFIILIVIAFCIAAPISGYFMQQWLENYPYRVDIGILVFVIGGFATLSIALATVGYQALRAATVNPIKSLRTE